MRDTLKLGIISSLIGVMVAGCVGMGRASDEDKAALDAWSKAVTDKDRAEVQRAASLHTEWMEERKVQWMISQYRSRYSHEQTKRAATQAATRAATQSATQPTTKSGL